MKTTKLLKTRKKVSHSELWAWAEETLQRKRNHLIGISASDLETANKSLHEFTESLVSEGWFKLCYEDLPSTSDVSISDVSISDVSDITHIHKLNEPTANIRLEAWLADRLLTLEQRLHLPAHVELESHHQTSSSQAELGPSIAHVLSHSSSTEDSEWAGFKFELPDDWVSVDDERLNDSPDHLAQSDKESARLSNNAQSQANRFKQENSIDVLKQLAKQQAIVLLITAPSLSINDATHQHDYNFLMSMIQQLKTQRKESQLLLLWLNPSVELDDTVYLKRERLVNRQLEDQIEVGAKADTKEKLAYKGKIQEALNDASEDMLASEATFDRVFQETFNAQAELAPIELSLDQSVSFDLFTDDPLIQISLGHVPLTVLPKERDELLLKHHDDGHGQEQGQGQRQEYKFAVSSKHANMVQDAWLEHSLQEKKQLEQLEQQKGVGPTQSKREQADFNYSETDYTTTELPALPATPNFSSLDRAQFSQCAQLAQEYFGPQALFLSAASICGPTCSMGQVIAVWKGVIDRPLEEMQSFNEQLWESLSIALSEGILCETHHQRFMTEPSFRFKHSRMTKFWRKRLETLLSTRLIRRAFRNLANWMSLQSINPIARPQVTLSVIDLWIEAGEIAQASQSSLHVAKLFLERGDGLRAKKALQKTIQLLGPDGHWPTWRECFDLLLKLTLEAGDDIATEMICKQFIERAWRVGDRPLVRKLTQLLEKLYKRAERYQEAEYLGEWSASQPFVDQATALFDAPLTIYPNVMVEEAMQTQKSNTGQDNQVSLSPQSNEDHNLQESQSGQENSIGPKHMNLPEIHTLEAPPAYLLQALITLRDHGYEAYVVGGSVRDRLLGREVNDWDLTTNALPNEVMHCFDKVIETGIEHGTVTVIIDQEQIEITTYRVDGDYLDGRRPEEVSFTRSLDEDLLRRDFTVNAIAWDPIDAQLRDPYDGCKDLQAKLLKAVGHPYDRFQEDGLRVLRAIRFATVLEFEIDPETQLGAIAALETLKQVAAERVQVELFKTLNAFQAGRGLQLIREFGVEEVCFPKQASISDQAWARIIDALNQCKEGLASRFALILHGIQAELQLSQVNFAQQAKATLKGLKLANKISQRILKLLTFSNIDPLQDRTSAQIRALAVEIGIEQLENLWAYQEAWDATESDLTIRTQRLKAWNELQSQMQVLDVKHIPKVPKDLKLNGHELCKALDIFPSKIVGEILNELLRWVWEDPQRNRYDSLVEQARLIATERGVLS